MSASHGEELVMMARRRRLERARSLLSRHGIASRASRPRRDEGTLRVADADAVKARELLHTEFGGEHVVSASEAAWFRCPSCREPLSAGAKVCSHCQTDVADHHGS